MCKGHTNDKQYNLVQGPQLEVQVTLKFWKILRPLHFFSWPLHVALAPLLVALAQALAPRKLLLFGRLSGMFIPLRRLKVAILELPLPLPLLQTAIMEISAILKA